MDNIVLKNMISDVVLDEEELDKIVVLEGDEFADGAIGITDDNRVVYGYERLVESLAKEYGSEESAREWIDYNTIRSIPYMESQGLNAPVIMYEFYRG